MLTEEGKLLAHRLQNDKYWTLPGGRVDINETTEEAVKREFGGRIKSVYSGQITSICC